MMRRSRVVLGGGFGGLFVATATFRATQNMAQTTLSLLGKSVGLNGAEIGGISALSNLAGVVTMLWITARLAPAMARRSVSMGLVLIIASLGLFALSFRSALLLGAIVLGVGGGLTMPSLATAVGLRANESAEDVEPDDHQIGPAVRHSATRALATFSVVLSASLLIGPLLESAVLSVSHQSLRVAYIAFVPIALIGLASVDGRRRGPGSSPRTRSQVLRGVGILFTNRRASLAMCAQALYAVPFSVVVVFGALIGKGLYHLTASGAEAAIAVFFATSLCSRAVVSWHPVHTDRIRVFAACVLMTLGGLVLLVTGKDAAVFFVALGLLGVPHGLTYPLALALIAEAVPREDLPRTNASFTAVSTVLNVVAPLACGVLIDNFGDRSMLLSVALPVLVLTAVLFHLRDAEYRPDRAHVV